MPGGSPTSRRGDGYEFVELREYVPGDDVRRIDWAASARSGELQTRVILEDVALILAAILDDSPSMRVGRRRSLLDAGREAMRAWYDVAESGDRLLEIAGDALVVRSHSPHPEREQAKACATSRTAHLSTAHKPSFNLARSLHVARTALHPGAAFLVISDFYDLAAQQNGLLYALARRCDCTALIARDPWYDGLPLAGIVRMQGAEGGTLHAYVGAQERAAYVNAVRAREAEVRKRFTAAGWRVGLLHEADGVGSLAAAFGVKHELAS